MKRTYNVFVDNGLFVLAYYLNKEIEDVTEKDIENNIEKMSERIFDFTACEKYANLKSMVFPNSALTQKGQGYKELAQSIKGSFELEGTGSCCRCGEKKVNIFNLINKTYVPGIVSLTMYNYSNNLQGVNICSHCLALTVFSILNCRVIQDVILYNHTDDYFMYDYTEEIQVQNNRDILIKAAKDDKKGLTKIDMIKKMWDAKDSTVYQGYLEQTSFNNIGLGMPTFEVKTLNNRNIELFDKLKRKGLWHEFITPEFELIWLMLEDKFEINYINKITGWNESSKQYEILCSDKLLEFLKLEVSGVSKELNEIINKVCNGIITLKKTEEYYKEIRYIDKQSKFVDSIMEITMAYFEMTGDSLLTENEFEKVTNRITFRKVKNIIIINLINVLGGKNNDK